MEIKLQRGKLPLAWNSFRFGSILFCSEFDSGNLHQVFQDESSNNCFNLYPSSDAAECVESETYRTWFHFYVTGIERGTTLCFTLKNLTNQSKLYSFGMRPFYRVIPHSSPHWQPIPTVPFYSKEGSPSFDVTFSH